MNCFCKTTAAARLWLYLTRLCFILSAIAYCISPYASFYAGFSCSKLSNAERLRRLRLETLKHRLLRADLLLCFTIVNGFIALKHRDIFIFSNNITRDNSLNLSLPHSRINCRKHFFSVRISPV